LAGPYILHKLRRDTAKSFASCGFELHSLLVMAGVCPIVAYRPKPGREEELLRLVRARVPTLRREGLATERAPVILRAKDGTIIEV
jgi:hypothetical protein